MTSTALIKRILLLLLCATLLLCGCGQKKETSLTKTVYAMDTLMTLMATGTRAQEALSAAETELFRLDALMNRHSETGEVARLNREGTLQNAELAALTARALLLSENTNGAFDCTLAPLIDSWNIAGGGRVPSEEELSGLLPLIGASLVKAEGDTITLAPGTQLDLGALGKGYAGERVREIYTQYGVTGSISLGGDNCLVGPKSAESPLWRVGLKKPGSAEEIVGVLSVTDTFTVTSGSYERYFTAADGHTYHHILDPSTGYPAENGLVSVTVLAYDGVQADALATAFFVMGAEKTATWLQNHSEVCAILITTSGKVLYSRALEGSFEPRAEEYTFEAF